MSLVLWEPDDKKKQNRTRTREMKKIRTENNKTQRKREQEKRNLRPTKHKEDKREQQQLVGQ